MLDTILKIASTIVKIVDLLQNAKHKHQKSNRTDQS